MEEAKAAGQLCSIGVSNMTPKFYREFIPQFKTKPAVNQMEFNPFFQQKELRKLMEADDVKHEAWYPLGHGDAKLLQQPEIVRLAEKYGKNTGQIILRFEYQEGVVTLPKSTNEGRIKGNIDLFNFALTEAEMNTLRALDTGKGAFDPEALGIEQMLRENYVITD